MTPLGSYWKAVQLEYEVAAKCLPLFSIGKFAISLPSIWAVYKMWPRAVQWLPLYFGPLVLVWLLVGNSLVTAYKGIRCALASFGFPKSRLPRSFYFVSSDPKFFFAIDRNETGYPSVIVRWPWSRIKLAPEVGFQEVEFLSCVGWREIALAVLCSAIVPFYFVLNGRWRQLLYTYHSFDWFLVYFAFRASQIDCLWFSNHCDRWASLFTNCGIGRLVMVQHGALAVRGENGSVVLPAVSERLRGISTVYCMDSQSERWFARFVEEDGLQYRRVKSPLTIARVDRPTVPCALLLILGYPGLYDIHREVAEHLALEFGEAVRVYLKPHPLQEVGAAPDFFEVCRSRNEIPDVDIVLSYGSTLDLEIETLCPMKRIVSYDYFSEFSSSMLVSHAAAAVREVLDG